VVSPFFDRRIFFSFLLKAECCISTLLRATFHLPADTKFYAGQNALITTETLITAGLLHYNIKVNSDFKTCRYLTILLFYYKNRDHLIATPRCPT